MKEFPILGKGVLPGRSERDVAGKRIPGVLRMFVLFRCLFVLMFLVLSEAEGKNLWSPWFSSQLSTRNSQWKPWVRGLVERLGSKRCSFRKGVVSALV
jgi:hypothetical protein